MITFHFKIVPVASTENLTLHSFTQANISDYVPRKSNQPPSPVLKTSIKSQSHKDSPLKDSINSDCGDDTLIARFSHCDATSGNAANSDNCSARQGQTLPNHGYKESNELDNDSVFSDIDMSYVERNCMNAIPPSKTEALQNDGQKLADKLTNTPLSLSSRNSNNPKTLSVTPVIKNPRPLAASTPASNRRKSMSEKLAER